MLECFDLESYVITLKNERPVFFSEADFQMALARLIAESNTSIKVMLEYPYYVEPGKKEKSQIPRERTRYTKLVREGLPGSFCSDRKSSTVASKFLATSSKEASLQK